MNITEAAKKSGISIQAIYRKIKNKRCIGRFFYRDHDNKWAIDARRIKRLR